jgi:tetratricopeptide (TPR) repeat protein
VKGVYTDITPICEALKQATQKCDQNLISISFIRSRNGNSTENIDENMSEYSKARSYYEKALGISLKTLSPNQDDLATSYKNVGWVYSKMGKYSKAFSFYEDAIDIGERSLPATHPNLQL